MKLLYKNGTWKLINLPPGKKPVRCQWIYMIKYIVDDIFEHFKTRLIGKGYTQTYRNDYIETFSSVAKINIIQILLSLVKNLRWSLQQFNVKNAFMYGELLKTYLYGSPTMMHNTWKVWLEDV